MSMMVKSFDLKLIEGAHAQENATAKRYNMNT